MKKPEEAPMETFFAELPDVVSADAALQRLTEHAIACHVISAGPRCILRIETEAGGRPEALLCLTPFGAVVASVLPSEASPAALPPPDEQVTLETIPIVQEELEIASRSALRGSYQLETRILNVPVTQETPLHDYDLQVARRPVDRSASMEDMRAFQPGTVYLEESAEEVVVEICARVVEEVIIRKTVRERVETIVETLRRTDVQVRPLATTELETSGTGISHGGAN
jgi:hypothetical protein